MDPTEDEVIDQDSNTTSEQEALDDAAFAAGFAHVSGNEPITNAATANIDGVTAEILPATDEPAEGQGDATSGATAEDEAAAAAAAQAEAERKAREEDEAPVTITKAQLNRLLAIADEVPTLNDKISRTHDTVAGKLGSLQQTVKQLQDKAGKGNTKAITSLKRLEEEFPELGKALREDLNELYGQAPEEIQQQNDAPLADPVQSNPLEAPEVVTILRQKEVAITEAVHPGFMQLAQTPDFAEWTSTLPPVAVDLLSSSWDSSITVPAFNDFKKWKAGKDAKHAGAATTKQQNDKRLERGIAPTDGATRSGQHVVDEDAAFSAGFDRVRKGGA